MAALQELRRHKPAVLYLPNIDEWFSILSDTAKITLIQSLEISLPSHAIFLATSNLSNNELSSDIQEIFVSKNSTNRSIISGNLVVDCLLPNKVEIELFFAPILREITSPTQKLKEIVTVPKVLELAIVEEIIELPEHDEISKLTDLTDADFQTQRRFRHELRGVNDCFRKDRVYKDFARPVNLELYPTYPSFVSNPLNLLDLYTRINDGHYLAPQDYLDDIELIHANAIAFCGHDSEVVGKV